MNLTGIVRKSFTNDKKTGQHTSQNPCLWLKVRTPRIEDSLTTGVLCERYFCFGSVAEEKVRKLEKDFEHLASSNLKSLCTLNLPSGSLQITSYRCLACLASQICTKQKLYYEMIIFNVKVNKSRIIQMDASDLKELRSDTTDDDKL